MYQGVSNEIAASDVSHLKAAEGWLELGNFLEANNELENIRAAEPHSSPRSRTTVPHIRGSRQVGDEFFRFPAPIAMINKNIPQTRS